MALLQIASTWGLSIADGGVVMIGDSPSNDIAFAKAAGAASILLDTGRRHTEGGTDGGADLVVSSLTEVPALLDTHFRVAEAARVPWEPLKKYTVPTPETDAAAAAVTGDVSALETLYKAGKLDEPPCASGNTPLIWAADAGQTAAVQYLLSLAATDVNVRGYLGATAVCRAARRGHTEVLDALVRDPRTACLDVPNDKLQSPLHFAAFKQQVGAVRVLLAHGASTEVRDRKARTPDEDTSNADIRDGIRMVRDGADPNTCELLQG